MQGRRNFVDTNVIVFQPLSPLNPKQIVELFQEAQRVAFHLSAQARKEAGGTSVGSKNSSCSSLPPQSLNFSAVSASDCNVSAITTDNAPDTPKTPRLRTGTFTKDKEKKPLQRKSTFTKDSPLNNVTEALNKALPSVEPVPKDRNGAVRLFAHGPRKSDGAAPPAFARGSGIRRSLPTSVGRGLKPVGIKSQIQVVTQNYNFVFSRSMIMVKGKTRHLTFEGPNC